MKTTLNFIAAVALAMSVTWLSGCFESSDPVTQDTTPTAPTTSIQPADIVIDGGALACTAVSTPVPVGFTSVPPANEPDDDVSGTVWNISDTPDHPNIGLTPKRLAITVPPTLPTGETPEDWTGEAEVHPLLVSYAEQVSGDYELGDGSADIGDPDNIDEIFVSMSLDNGKSWKKYQVSDSADKSSINVAWDTSVPPDGIPENNVTYPGHSHKPTMAVQGNNIAVAWLDKYCPSGDPLDLVDDEGNIVMEDYFHIKGNQGSINYDLPCTISDPLDADFNCAPNGKAVYEVPFSCVWTARGEFVETTDDVGNTVYEIVWRKPQQLTSGMRDANKIAIAAAAPGFAYVWQEDPEGLRSGKGAGPGVGWSGATTNHGADIWFTKINMVDYLLVVDDQVETKWEPLVNYDYPVRITDNEKCNGETDTKLYCQAYCSGDECVTNDIDMLSYSTKEDGPYNATLDGDTGASRPAMKILQTDAVDDNGDPVDEFVVILGYEETKGLAETIPGDPNQDQGDLDPTDTIDDEGKSVYFESFLFPQVSVLEAAAAGALPVVSAGYIVNILVPEVQVTDNDDGTSSVSETGEMVYENARRLVIMGQVDPCEAGEGDYTFGFLYKQGIYTRGGPSDMFIRMNTGFSYNTFVAEDGVLNVSSHEVAVDEEGKFTDEITWDETMMQDQSYTVLEDNTFSPRGWLRGSDIITGFEYTPNWDMSESGCVPNNFHINRYVDGVWYGPQNISNVQGPCVSTLDPRFHPTPKGKDSDLLSDRSARDTIVMVYGTFDMATGEELDLYYTRSTDMGATWELVERQSDGALVNDKLAARDGVQEKEAQVLVSPDGTMLYTVWNQEHDRDEHPDANLTVPERFLGLDSWLGRVDYVVTSE